MGGSFMHGMGSRSCSSAHTLAAAAAWASHGENGFHCERRGAEAEHRLLLWGNLPVDWSANLTLHLAALGTEVISGDAACLDAGIWCAGMVLRAEASDRELGEDFLRMARRAPRALPGLPVPDVRMDVERSRSEPDHYFARVTGSDSLGLLAEVLRRFGSSGLRPRRFSLRTADGRVNDWFWLESTGPRFADAL